MNQVKKLRNDGEGGDIAIAQRTQQFSRVQGFEIDDARAFHQWKEQIGHLRENVEHGQNAQQRVGWAEIDPVEYGFHFAQKIRMSEHYPLGIGGGSGGVEQGSNVIRSRGHRLKVPSTTLEDRRQVRQPRVFRGAIRQTLRVHEYETNVKV